MLYQGSWLGAIVLLFFLLPNILGTLMWRWRDRISPYPAIQALVAVVGLLSLLTLIAFDVSGRAAGLDAYSHGSPRSVYWILLIFPAAMITFHLQNRSGKKKRGEAQMHSFEKLASGLRSANWAEREDAAQFLGELGDPRAIPLLLRALEDESGEVQLEAMGALERFGGQVLPGILECLESDNPRTQDCAMRIVSRLAGQEFETASQARAWYAGTKESVAQPADGTDGASAGPVRT